MRAEHDDRETVVVCLEGARSARRNAHGVKRLQIHELLVKLDSSGAREHD
jgi:hypothetical protein